VNPPGDRKINQGSTKSKTFSKDLNRDKSNEKSSSSSSAAVAAPSSSGGLSSSKVIKPVLESTTVAPPLTGLTLREQLDLAVRNLDIGRDPVPQEREKEMNEIQDLINGSLIALSKGHGHDLSDDVNNIFVSGLPGCGKTLSVKALLRQMEAEQREREEEQNIPKTPAKKKGKEETDDDASKDALPKFVVVKIIGLEVRHDTFYQTIANKLGMLDSQNSNSSQSIVSGTAYNGIHFSAGREIQLKKEILARFRNDRQCLGRGKAAKDTDPVTILMIDEIDKAPKYIIRELLEIAAVAAPRNFISDRLEIAAVPTFNIPSTSGPFACRVVIIGISNFISFSTEVNVSSLAEHAFKDVPFEPYKLAALESILIKRCMGTFTDGAIAMLAGRGLRALSGNFKRS
jgi:Cdc6-like AAA superfamily ATPase